MSTRKVYAAPPRPLPLYSSLSRLDRDPPHRRHSDRGTLPTLGGSTAANAINSWEQIVGVSTLSSGARHAFLYGSAAMVDLKTLGGTNSEALDVNDAGHVVGVSDTASGQQRAFVYRDGTMMTSTRCCRPGPAGCCSARRASVPAGRSSARARSTG